MRTRRSYDHRCQYGSVGKTWDAELGDYRSRYVRPQGWTYIIAADGSPLLKIGQTSKEPEQRLAALQTGSPLKLRLLAAVPGMHLEQLFHLEHAKSRSHGEWFESIALRHLARAMAAQISFAIAAEERRVHAEIAAQELEVMC